MACSPPRVRAEWRRNGAIRTPNFWFHCKCHLRSFHGRFDQRRVRSERQDTRLALSSG